MLRALLILGGAGLLAVVAFFIWAIAADPGLMAPDHYTEDPVEIADILSRDLGLEALPDGMEGYILREGGFQDRFVQARLKSTKQGIEDLLAALELDWPAAPGWPAAPPIETGPDGTIIENFRDIALVVETNIPPLVFIRITFVAVPGKSDVWAVHITGHET